MERADLFIGSMYGYAMDLIKKREEPEFLIELHSPRKRKHVLEIALAEDKAELRVYEMTQGCAKVCFKWNGERSELQAGIGDFGVMILALKF